jgi:hypothetical protein
MDEASAGRRHLGEVDDGVALLDKRVVGVSDDQAVVGRFERNRVVAASVGDNPETLSRADIGAKLRFKPKNSAVLGADPGGLVDEGRVIASLSRGLAAHAKGCQDAEGAVAAQADCLVFKSERLAGFIDESSDSGVSGGFAQRAVDGAGMHNNGRRERFGQSAGFFVFEVRSDLGKIGAVVRASVEVDAKLTLEDDFIQKEIGEAGGEGAALRTWERSVEIAPIWEVARLGIEAKDVYDGRRNQAAGQRRRFSPFQDLSDDFDAVHFVAVNGGADPKRGARPAAVDDDQRQGKPSSGGQASDGDFKPTALAGIDVDSGDLDGFILNLFHDRAAFQSSIFSQ